MNKFFEHNTFDDVLEVLYERVKKIFIMLAGIIIISLGVRECCISVKKGESLGNSVKTMVMSTVEMLPDLAEQAETPDDLETLKEKPLDYTFSFEYDFEGKPWSIIPDSEIFCPYCNSNFIVDVYEEENGQRIHLKYHCDNCSLNF